MNTKLYVKKNPQQQQTKPNQQPRTTSDNTKRSTGVQIIELLVRDLKQLWLKYSRKKDKIDIFQHRIETIKQDQMDILN